jgi:DNA phosphorothioation-associated putative methyltransferase
MVRHTLSQPMSLAVRHGLIKPGLSVFDYGCGQGDDLRALATAGVEASGWDPHFATGSPIHEAEIVNLGFVLNVIENPAERLRVLSDAWAIAGRALLVSVMIVGAVPVDGLRQFGDGYLTTRGTFQKYFQQAEIKALVSQNLGVEPIALAPGIFVAFRSPEDEQDFLLERRRGHRASTSVYRTQRPVRTPVARPSVANRISEAIDSIAVLALDRGRLPHPDEIPPHVHAVLAGERVSFARALDIARDEAIDGKLFETAAAARRDDLLVHQALNTLNRSKSASRLSPAMIRDIRHHFGNQQQFADEGLNYLRALADPERTVAAMRSAAELGLGALDEDGRLVIDDSRVESLDGVLRCFVGCAVYLSGSLQQSHLVRLDPLRRRVMLFALAEKRSAFPITTLSTTIDLKRQDVTIREDKRFLARKADVFGMASKSRQRSVERERRALGGFDEHRVLVRL